MDGYLNKNNKNKKAFTNPTHLLYFGIALRAQAHTKLHSKQLQ